ncbi:MAG TPA: nitroreductase family deazaflavin-dependent oxidoreductase [Candidatus Dormibacteraeota bacterium]|nr:nitroreductase family deazaflavin-dependent oxidoreductase [Candidatus Dormibacteraeota bacterium]
MIASTAPARAPRFIPFFNPLALRLLRRGRLMGPNTLLTVRGRKSGEMRTTPVALVELEGRRWIIGTFGETNWVRNLRAASEGIIAVGDRRETVRARELSRDEAATFFATRLKPYVAGIPLGFGRVLLGILRAGDIVRDPAGAAAHRPVFELTLRGEVVEGG